MSRFSASLIISLILNGCNHDTSSADSLPVTQGPSDAMEESSNARPTARFPARVAVARIEGSHGGFRTIPETDVEQDDG